MLSENVVPIENFEIVTTNTATSFKVEIASLKLFTYVNLRVYLFDLNGNTLSCNYLIISGEDYTNWANNDEYIINYITNKYGFILKPDTSTVAAEVAVTDVVTDTVVDNKVVENSIFN